ncbi:hypothetical protein EYF80_033392 [Liparis tanakae]|uniref:Uncharacterized protein n=1 Tax=Liparis tanakae TaxID=230148 RepID=A0A4Z2GSZ5_9TELE|nr:hypothetical protein EYF80_033392 [Liparis tanakae]
METPACCSAPSLPQTIDGDDGLLNLPRRGFACRPHAEPPRLRLHSAQRDSPSSSVPSPLNAAAFSSSPFKPASPGSSSSSATDLLKDFLKVFPEPSSPGGKCHGEKARVNRVQ